MSAPAGSSALATRKRLVAIAVSALLAIAGVAAAEPARIAAGLEAGAPQRLSGVRYSGGTDGGRLVTVLPRGDGFLVFEQHGFEVRVVGVDASGHPTGPARTVFSMAPALSPAVIVSNASGDALLMWYGGPTRIAPIDRDGNVGDLFAVALRAYGPAACNETRCIFVDVSRPDVPVATATIVSLRGAVIAKDVPIGSVWWLNAMGLSGGGFLLSGIDFERQETHLARIDNTRAAALRYDVSVEWHRATSGRGDRLETHPRHRPEARHVGRDRLA